MGVQNRGGMHTRESGNCSMVMWWWENYRDYNNIRKKIILVDNSFLKIRIVTQMAIMETFVVYTSKIKQILHGM